MLVSRCESHSIASPSLWWLALLDQIEGWDPLVMNVKRSRTMASRWEVRWRIELIGATRWVYAMLLVWREATYLDLDVDLIFFRDQWL